MSALSKILDNITINFPDFGYSSIVNIHLSCNKNYLPSGFYGLINSPVHWIFNKGTHLNIVISDADYLVAKSDEEILKIVKTELQTFFNLNPDIVNNHKIISGKEHLPQMVVSMNSGLGRCYFFREKRLKSFQNLPLLRQGLAPLPFQIIAKVRHLSLKHPEHALGEALHGLIEGSLIEERKGFRGKCRNAPLKGERTMEFGSSFSQKACHLKIYTAD